MARLVVRRHKLERLSANGRRLSHHESRRMAWMPSHERGHSAPPSLQALSLGWRRLWRHLERRRLRQFQGERRRLATWRLGEFVDRGGWMRVRQRLRL
eukprot:2206903-Prymnesium_polylepis.1